MNVQHLLPRLTLHRQFAEDLWAAKAPCFALGMVEERQEPMGLLALRPPKAMPKEAMALGFNLAKYAHPLYRDFQLKQERIFFYLFAFPHLKSDQLTFARERYQARTDCTSTGGLVSVGFTEAPDTNRSAGLHSKSVIRHSLPLRECRVHLLPV
ncbi:hypothetical protein RAE19_18480 [Rhodoferax sp. TBRC 17660]|uniref:Uncharacterized protein n=1 Tax=Rhodoferax potami TaxID=3068338 RepID=A0ABU3KSD1_9BURK|nr:hypothetical protein [Rhodoferax sp. TBRC 17660]MDT7520651.1 hypothetical protein [Rhodoferax sp. TBRC 17660]